MAGKTFKITYLGTEGDYNVVMAGKMYKFPADKEVSCSNEDVATYVSNLKESEEKRARLLFEVTEDTPEAVTDEEGVTVPATGSLRLSAKKKAAPVAPAKTGEEV